MSRSGNISYSMWNGVYQMNSYAVFLAYLSMAIKGLGFLVLTWTTVVLLGGFVSILRTKDFWCLTFITLVQMAGIFNAALNEKLRDVMNSAICGLGLGIYFGVKVKAGQRRSKLVTASRHVLASALMVVQLVLFATLLCPLAFVYVFGILISAGVSLSRLIQHDYLGKSNGEASNLVPALNTLYYLALLQGVLFCYKFILGRTEKRLANELAPRFVNLDAKFVSKYLRETISGCEKDPSYAKGRNLITHAIEMIGSRSPADCDSGVKLLYRAINFAGAYDFDEEQELLKHLLFSTSCSRQILQKLLEKLDSRGTHDRLTRKKAAKIVERIAIDINLEQFPRGIEHISSLIGTFQHYSVAEAFQGQSQSNNELRAYKKLLLRGMCILQKLAKDGNNCRVISDTQHLVSRIMAPVTSDLLEHKTDDHGAWSDVVEGSIKVIIQLTSAPGETGTKLRREISSCEEAIKTLWRIISCNKCREWLKKRAIRILTRLYMDTEGRRCGAEFVVISSCSREAFVKILVDIFTSNNKPITITRFAGAALSVLCFHGGISDVTTDIETGGGDVIDSLAKVLGRDKNTACRQTTAAILEHLCTQYTKHDTCWGKLKKAMADVMPEVIGAILQFGDQIPNGNETDQECFAKTKGDIENQCEDEAFQAFEESIRPVNLVSSLLSLCGTVYDTYITELDPDLAHQFHDTRFIDSLKKIVENSDHPTVDNVLLLKAIGKMVISTMKHDGGKLVNQEDLKSLIELLSSASKNLMELDYSMVFSFTNSCGTIQFTRVTPLKLSSCTLASVMNEAEELHAKMPSTSVSG